MLRLRLLPALLAAALLAGCGGDDGATAADARAALERVKPLPSAQVRAGLTVAFDNAPVVVGDRLELTFRGPLRNNGADKLPSLDWKIDFSGFATRFASRLVSTGDNVFINLGGQDFEVGTDAVGRATAQAQDAQRKGGVQGLAALGIDPLDAARDVREAGQVSVAGTDATRYRGRIDVDTLIRQYETLTRTATAAGARPPVELTAEQRAQVKRTFGRPVFEAAVAEDDTIRRLVVSTRFTTPAANRAEAGGITGGRIEYRLEYSRVGEAVTITPPKDVQPIRDFAQELERLLGQVSGQAG